MAQLDYEDALNQITAAQADEDQAYEIYRKARTEEARKIWQAKGARKNMLIRSIGRLLLE
jgi:hypothetical protein